MEHAMIVTPAGFKRSINLSNSMKTPNSRTFLRARLVGASLIILLVGLPAFAAEKNPNSSCLECHSDKTLSKTNATGKEISLFVDEVRFAMGVHKTNACISCHTTISAKHPDDNVVPGPANCGTCHANPTDQYASSIHGASHKMGASGA